MSITTLHTRAPAVSLTGVTKTYGRSEGTVRALDDVSLTFERGTFTAIMRPSGSGKTTLLQCAAGLDRPDGGTTQIGATELTGMRERPLARLRRENVGFVFQSFNLLPSLTAAQNTILPLRLAGERPLRRTAGEALARVGLADRARHRPAQLSGGQQQRVAIARALVTEPEVIFADEPTGALDTRSAREVLTILRRMTDEDGRTLVMVTHDPVSAAVADHVVFLADGRVVDEIAGAAAEVVADRILDLGRSDAETADQDARGLARGRVRDDRDHRDDRRRRGPDHGDGAGGARSGSLRRGRRGRSRESDRQARSR